MNREVIQSVGIDIGTSTTQLVFSRFVVENLAGSYAVPRVSIIEKEVTYRSQIYFTPLKSATEIDADAVKEIVRREYAAAGRKPEELHTGAVIITGETARKQNANDVLAALSDMAGDFVVATAGPDLESVLAGRGAGADVYSKEERTVVANLDVGGGTTNIAIFDRGELKGVCCLDIGGRLIKIENNKISYIFPKTKSLARSHGIDIEVGERADVQKLRKICAIMADHVAQSVYAKPMDGEHKGLYTNDGKPLPSQPAIRAVTYSGGVADYVYHTAEDDPFRYGDIGVLLGEAIQANQDLKKLQLLQATETIRATVVGAGTHTTEISGSTISYAEGRLPLKNVPILKVSEEDEASPQTLESSIKSQLPIYMPEGKPEQVAIAFTGQGRTSFAAIQEIAKAVINGAQEVMKADLPLILVVENDIAKALGHALNVQLEHKKDVICIDNIRTLSGDYIDIGEPVGGGHVVPVVIKTLVFNS